MIDFSTFDAYIDTHTDRFIQRLRDLVRLPSVSAQGGPAMRQIADAVLALCLSLGYDARQVEVNPGQPPFIIAEMGPKDAQRTLMIYNHYDVQPPEPLDLWTVPPFDVTEHAGCASGRARDFGHRGGHPARVYGDGGIHQQHGERERRRDQRGWRDDAERDDRRGEHDHR